MNSGTPQLHKKARIMLDHNERIAMLKIGAAGGGAVSAQAAEHNLDTMAVSVFSLGDWCVKHLGMTLADLASAVTIVFVVVQLAFLVIDRVNKRRTK